EEPVALPQAVTAAVGLAGLTPSGPLLVVCSLTAGEGVHWRHMFWIFGSLGVAWCLAFWWWFRDRPEQPPAVNQAELAHIQGSPPPAGESSHAGVPWRRLLTSGNLWALCLMYFCAAYGWYFNITWLPKYLGTEHGVTQQTRGFWTMSLLSGAPL